MNGDMLVSNEVEEGEISDGSDVEYTPLERPAVVSNTVTVESAAISIPDASCHQIENALDDDDDDEELSSSGESSSDALLRNGGEPKSQRKRRTHIRRTVMVRVEPNDAETQEKRSRFKKYNIWTEALQEDALTETMRGCDVARKKNSDRNVENYDYTLRYRLNGENCLKRRLSHSADDFSDGEYPATKRGRPSSRGGEEGSQQRRAVKSRLGHRSRTDNRRGSSSTSDSQGFEEPRIIEDLINAEMDTDELAKEMAQKLDETNDQLLCRIVEVLGAKLPLEVYKETQRIEAKGGMMTISGLRRRTPGGVFLFLLKNHERLSQVDKKAIFSEENSEMEARRKVLKNKARDRKVEELKKRLSEQERDLSTRKDHVFLGSELSMENQAGNLSNPPPSPVGREQSPEYRAHAINHVVPDVDANLVKPSTSSFEASTSRGAKDLIDYDDDILDVNCGEMDLF